VSFTDLSLIVALRRVTSTYVQFQPMNARAFASLDAQIFFYVETRTLRHRDGERSVHSYIALFDAVDQRPFICVCVCVYTRTRTQRTRRYIRAYVYLLR